MEDLIKLPKEIDNRCQYCNNEKCNIIKLDCGHEFCYYYVINWWIEVKRMISTTYNRYNYVERSCMLCNKKNSLIEINVGDTYIPGIHRSKNNCEAVIKYGSNKGKKCNNKVKYGNYCGVHKSYSTSKSDSELKSDSESKVVTVVDGCIII